MENIQKVNGHDNKITSAVNEAAVAKDGRRVRRNSPIVQAAFPNKEELQLVREAAQANGASVSGFVRMAVVQVARRVLNRHEKGEF